MARTIVGTVWSSKNDKTISVVSHGRRTHPIYKKQYPVSKKFLAHDEKNEAQEGDKVLIIETRPISAKKRFKLERILERPTLREEALAATRDEEASKRPPSKKKAEETEAEVKK